MPINPIEVVNIDRLEELDQARASINGQVIRSLRRSLRNPFKQSRLPRISQSDMAELLGVYGYVVISEWEREKSSIAPQYLLTLHRLKGVVAELSSLSLTERYLFLVDPQDGLMQNVQVSPIELLRMESSVGYKAVIASIELKRQDLSSASGFNGHRRLLAFS